MVLNYLNVLSLHVTTDVSCHIFLYMLYANALLYHIVLYIKLYKCSLILQWMLDIKRLIFNWIYGKLTIIELLKSYLKYAAMEVAL